VLTTCVTAPFWTSSWAPSLPEFPEDGVFLPAEFSSNALALLQDNDRSLEIYTAEKETGALQAKGILYAKVDLVRKGTEFNLYIRPPTSNVLADYNDDKQFWARINCPRFFEPSDPYKACFYSAKGFKKVKIERNTAGDVYAEDGNPKHKYTAHEFKTDTPCGLIKIGREKVMEISIPSAPPLKLKLVKLAAGRFGKKKMNKLNMFALSVAMMNHALRHWFQ